MHKKEPSVLTRMRLSCCWGDNLNEKELTEVVDYINYLQNENQQLQNKWNELKEFVEKAINECKVVMNTILPELEEIILSINGKSPLINEYEKQQMIIKFFEVMLSKMEELESRK